MNDAPSAGESGRPVLVAIDRGAMESAPEVTYVLRTLLRCAGLPWTFVWGDSVGGAVDIAYGSGTWRDATVRIPRVPWPFALAPDVDPIGTVPFAGTALLRFANESVAPASTEPDLSFPVDVLFGAFWWLTGAREPTYPRDKRDNISLEGTVIRDAGLLDRPVVSLIAALLRSHFEERGFAPRQLSWQASGKRAAFVLTGDVDYPEIIRWIEVPRILASRRKNAVRLATDVALGRSHYWTFREWVDFAAEFGTQPAFYFMARQGSLLQYALGTPDDFYDVRSPRFAALFTELREAGCEIGLHASYHAHRAVDQLRHERERIEEAAGVRGIGNRHHYWHLDPADPNETLRRHEAAGLRYDSSLGYEFYPGFRRGTCHPFRVFHAGDRRELDIVQLPPAWMDDHFGRRLSRNGITDPEAAALALVDVARQTGGTVTVDYHSRGANAAIYPEYGPWFMAFARTRLGSDLAFMTPSQAVNAYRESSALIDRLSASQLDPGSIAVAPGGLEIAPLREQDVGGVAAIHARLFGDPAVNGHSVGTLGPDILADVFYRLNLDNESFFCDVARVDGGVVGFSVYSTDRSRVFRHPLASHPVRLALACTRGMLRRPAVLRSLLGNLAYLGGERLEFLDGVRGWWIVAGVAPEYRQADVERRLGGPIAARLFDCMEARLRAAGCPAWYGVVRPDNEAINRFLVRRGARVVGMAEAQGLQMRYYVKRFDPVSDPGPE